jgi:predicted enzyme related to lactoylglutathione lyase
VDGPQVAWGEVTIDCRAPERVAAFWGALFGATVESGEEGWFHLGPTVHGGPRINFQPVPEEKVGKARVHLDVWVDDIDAAISLVEQLGGTHTAEVHAGPGWSEAVMADPEGTEFCLVALRPRE